jgi:hypothetical protein
MRKYTELTPTGRLKRTPIWNMHKLIQSKRACCSGASINRHEQRHMSRQIFSKYKIS